MTRVLSTGSAGQIGCCLRIRQSVAARAIDLLVSDDELARRRSAMPVVEPTAARGYRKLFLQTVTQADLGVDFDFPAWRPYSLNFNTSVQPRLTPPPSICHPSRRPP